MKHLRDRYILTMVGATMVMIVLFVLLLAIGSVSVSVSEVIDILFRNVCTDEIHKYIVTGVRLPMALSALIAGAALSVAGILLQTTFDNPLAGPSILGVSTGASLGVATLMLGGALWGIGLTSNGLMLAGAVVGAGAVMLLLTFFSGIVRSGLMLLIAGIMVSYLSSSAITLLNFFSPAEDVKAFMVWGMGSFSGTDMSQCVIMGIAVLILTCGAYMMSKPLNLLLLGERYTENAGYSIKSVRTLLLFLSGLLTAVVTAYCGPIGFIGLIVPHVARMLIGSSNHERLIPASVLIGATVSMFCAFISVWLPNQGQLPINAVTPLIGVPLIIYIIVRRSKQSYFS